MKKQILSFASIVLVAGSIILVACKKKDTTAPVITVVGDLTKSIYVGDSYSELGATATDDVDGDISSSIKTSGSVDATKSGTNTITYSVSDKAGNAATPGKRTVNVKHKNTTVVGTYSVIKTCTPSSGSGSYTSAVTAYSGNDNVIIMSNFDGQSIDVQAALSDTYGTVLTIDNQAVNGFYVSNGSVKGDVSNNGRTLTINYMINGMSCSATMTR